ncbi:MAG: sn-glycerol-3-phosphate ABC transporter ATP-binding protein UgpC [Acidimicrobiales bacterium]
MAAISLEHVAKTYPNGVEVIADLSLEVGDGEFMVLVGPSGCGKTTALRMVAGLERISKGTVKIGGRVVNSVSPKDRDIAMVFQNYALYPHMTVEQNIGFSLKLKKLPRNEVNKKVLDTIELLGLSECTNRKPLQLSGGQRQRVAMGRAIVREPSAFLMDEPLSNLDAKLRVQMRSEVTRIQKQVGVATLYVTHDQVEAMTMGDRVAVIRAGALQQCDSPKAIYDRPANIFVASFMGAPPMNLFEGFMGESARSVKIGSETISLPNEFSSDGSELRKWGNKKVVVGVRPEDFLITSKPGDAREEGIGTIRGEVAIVEELGFEQLVHFAFDANMVSSESGPRADDDLVQLGGNARRSECIARVDARIQLKTGDRVEFGVAPRALHFFDPVAGSAIEEK